jgi:hypothetical protein
MLMKELAPFMEESQLISANMCDFKKYDWPQADFGFGTGHRTLCGFFLPMVDAIYAMKKMQLHHYMLLKGKPRITNVGGKGQGVRAIGLTYLKDQILRDFIGKSYPLIRITMAGLRSL